MYKIALFGYSCCGKTALFKKITGRKEEIYDPFKPNIGIGAFFDKDLDKVAKVAKARKTVYPEFEFCDYKGLPETSGFSEERLNPLLSADLVCCTVNNFSADAHPDKESGSLLMELILYDSARIEKLLSRGEEHLKSFSPQQLKILEEGLQFLEDERFLNELEDGKKKLLRGIELLTIKPILLYINGGSKPVSLPYRYIQQAGGEFDGELLFKGILKEMSLASFYTIKGDIAQSWLVPDSLTAREAAGKVHKDIEKGFIRAAALHFKDFIEIGDWHKAKNMGVLKFLGPNSKIADKDVVEFYFSR